MKVGEKGIALIKQFESCKLKAYKDSVGVCTIGYGHTASAGGIVPKLGMTITQEQAELQFRDDLNLFAEQIEKLLTVKPGQNQFDAMVSLAFNIGVPNFAKSTVLKLHNSVHPQNARDAFMMWDRAGGRVLRGLVRRRIAEGILYGTPDNYEKPETVPQKPELKPELKPKRTLGQWLGSVFNRA